MTVYAFPTPLVLGPNDPDWYHQHENLALLFRYLEHHDIPHDEASSVLEKPWKYWPEFKAALAWREKELAAA